MSGNLATHTNTSQTIWRRFPKAPCTREERQFKYLVVEVTKTQGAFCIDSRSIFGMLGRPLLRKTVQRTLQQGQLQAESGQEVIWTARPHSQESYANIEKFSTAYWPNYWKGYTNIQFMHYLSLRNAGAGSI